MRVSRIYRLLQLITLLQSGRNYTPDELADELEVSKRTVFRDLNVLEMANIPYYFDSDRNGYRINGHFFLPPINLNLAEALSILALTGRIKGANQLPLLNQASRAAMKLETALPNSVKQYVGSIIERIGLHLGPLAKHEGLDGIFDDLVDATASKCICRITYHSFFEKSDIRTRIHPLRMVFFTRAWYVIAFSEMHKEVRTFKISRIENLSVCIDKFQPPKDFDGENYFGDAWQMIPEGKIHNVHIHFEPKVAGNVAEVLWHKSQKIEKNPDGSIEFRAKVDGLGEIGWWVLGYGDQAKVIKPAKLRNYIKSNAKAMLDNYKN